ncbi:type II toxin-antitoxin system VapC family toxin [Opitutaceae bacterium TAV4]|uniref:type II toxin-antitoxin system VapC family toxin n=1 Tax=Geminisphaera colitermitum TaxID=1148786 RepID=UPI0005BC160C|nr:type II toxin-antitoxin system VapC family toxin [Geminisphaera colitermitum]RRJ95835.1 type II toxin-antitoxin system VapC family toxin [Opitutaceae bacterium TAV4]RRJ99168.1 type II toxin-antitoxin system VapC family toxin [Opitutaceae bacterium TAV3]
MLLLDTSFLIEYESEIAASVIGPARGYLRARPLELPAVSIITLGEFAEGFDEPVDVEAFLSRFRVVSLSRSIAYKAAAMQSVLPQRLGENDAWIAATALVYDADLIGREKAFARVPRLRYRTF